MNVLSESESGEVNLFFYFVKKTKKTNLRKSNTCSSSALSTKIRSRANNHPPPLISIYNVKSNEFYFTHKNFTIR